MINIDQPFELGDSFTMNPTATSTETTIHPTISLVAPPGLKGVVVADTEIGSVRGQEGFYHYREFEATALAREASLEGIWRLVLDGIGPRAPGLGEFTAEIGRARVVDGAVIDLVAATAAVVQPPHLVLCAALPLLLPAAEPTMDQSHEQRRTDVVRIAAATPTILGIVRSVREGRRIELADPTVSHAEDWIRLATGGSPREEEVRAVETYLGCTVDHGFNASTFATRVVTSTGSDAAGALGAGVAALAGPLHGGAPARALAMIDAIGEPSNAKQWVHQQLASGNKIMGFGHAVYRAEDPRSALMREVAEGFGGPLVERAIAIEGEVLDALNDHKPTATIVTNVEYYAGVVLHLAGLPADAFTSCFTVSRVIGWAAHLLEQASNNKIIRPAASYVGPPVR